MATRTVTGTIKRPDGELWVAARVAFALEKPTFTATGTFPQDSVAVTAADGTFSVDLETDLPVRWLCHLPNGDRFAFVLSGEGGPTSIEELRAFEGVDEPETNAVQLAVDAVTTPLVERLAEAEQVLGTIPIQVAGAVAAAPTVVAAAETAVTGAIAGRSLIETDQYTRPVLVVSPAQTADRAGAVTPTLSGGVGTAAGTYGPAWLFTSTNHQVRVTNAGYVSRQKGTILVRASCTALAVNASQSLIVTSAEGFRLNIRRNKASDGTMRVYFGAGNGLINNPVTVPTADDTLVTYALAWENGAFSGYVNGTKVGSWTAAMGSADPVYCYLKGSTDTLPMQVESQAYFGDRLTDSQIAALSVLAAAHTITTRVDTGVLTLPARAVRLLGADGGASQLVVRDAAAAARAIGVSVGGQVTIDGAVPSVGPGAVTPASTTFAVQSANLYDASAATLGAYVDHGSGALVSFANYVTSDFIPVKAGTAYTLTPGRKLAFYSPAKAFVAGYDLTQSASPHTYTAPQDGYLRFAFSTMAAGYTANVQCVAGASLPTYAPFMVTIPKLRIDKSQVTGATAPLAVNRSGDALTIAMVLPSGQLSIGANRTGSANGGFTWTQDSFAGVVCHSTSDDITPLRFGGTTVGANHGYTYINSYDVAGHDKTTADLGSTWTDGSRTYTLLAISGTTLVFGRPYSESGGVVSGGASPAATLTHLANATHTASVPITTAGAITQLYPSVTTPAVSIWLDGVEVTADGDGAGAVLEIREQYTVLDYKAIVDWAQAHVGSWFGAARDTIGGVITVRNLYRYTAGGACTVSTSFTALRKVTLENCGGVQSVILGRSGYTASRHMPGVVSKGGYDFSGGLVDMTSYATSLVFGPSDYVNPAQPPSWYMDWLSSGGVRWIGFAMGYLPDKGNSRDAARTSLATGWDMRNTKKSYPVAVSGETLNRGDVRTIHAFRAYLDPTIVGSAAGLAVAGDGAGDYLMASYLGEQIGTLVAMPGDGRTVTPVKGAGLTAAPSVSGGGVLVTVPSTGHATLKVA